MTRWLFWFIAMLMAGAGTAAAQMTIANASAEQGKETIRSYGCVACHVIAGLPGPYGRVGPTLTGLRSRGYIAGSLPNRSQELVSWLLDPPRHVPSTAMPNMGLSDAEARNIAAYLYSLR